MGSSGNMGNMGNTGIMGCGDGTGVSWRFANSMIYSMKRKFQIGPSKMIGLSKGLSFRCLRSVLMVSEDMLLFVVGWA